MRIHLFLYLIAFSCTIARVSRTKLIRYWAFPTIGPRVRVHDVHAVHPMDHRVSETSTALDWAPPDRGIDWGIHGDARRDRDGGEETGLALDTKTFGPFFKITARRLPRARASCLKNVTRKSSANTMGSSRLRLEYCTWTQCEYITRAFAGRMKGELRSLFGISILLGTSSALMAHEAVVARWNFLPSTMETTRKETCGLLRSAWVREGSRRW